RRGAREARARAGNLHHAPEARRDRAHHARDRGVRGQVPSADAAEQSRPGVLVANRHPTAEQLSALAPLDGLSPARLGELAELAQIERAARGADPLRGCEPARPVFLLQGELLLAFEGGGTLVVVGGTGEGCRPLNRGRPPLERSKAITDVDLLTLDDELLDVLATWDHAVQSDARRLNGAFAL